jgi:hypothetical protein
MSPVSFSSISPGQFELTPCRVTYKGVDLGATLGNVVVKIEESLSELKSDQLGSTIIDKKVSGFKVTIETELAEIQLKDNWKVVFPSHKLVTSGSDKIFYFDSTIGSSMRDLAGQLVLHPLSKVNADKSADILVWLATAEGKADISFSPSDQQKLKVTWSMYPDFTTSPPRFMLYGDPAVGLVAASAGSATAGTGNTGNGTVGSITPYSGHTKDETITLQCVTAVTNGGKFFVSGSTSGALGIATVGSSFVSSVISFTIADGATDFAVNDTFSIATVAANYQ